MILPIPFDISSLPIPELATTRLYVFNPDLVFVFHALPQIEDTIVRDAATEKSTLG